MVPNQGRRLGGTTEFKQGTISKSFKNFFMDLFKIILSFDVQYLPIKHTCPN